MFNLYGDSYRQKIGRTLARNRLFSTIHELEKISTNPPLFYASGQINPSMQGRRDFCMVY
jgi:hypothetical protein